MPITNINVDNWEQFEARLNEVRDGEAGRGRETDFLYRGLANSSWKPETTLERAGHRGIPISEYYRVIGKVKPQIESFTSARWKIQEFPHVDSLLRSYDGWFMFPDQATYSYMIHLRHHGFPSPLLDWTRSYHIAAFFAFRTDSGISSDDASIYVLSIQPRGVHGRRLGQPTIRSMGSLTTTHRRHFLQHSEYTMCAVFDSDQRWRFAKHEDVFARDDPSQDVLWKFNIRRLERAKVLRLFDSYNLNAFSLFGSEESLMETLSLRELELRDDIP